MEIKHKECFTPMFDKHFGLQAASNFARECWDFVNPYSKNRAGIAAARCGCGSNQTRL